MSSEAGSTTTTRSTEDGSPLARAVEWLWRPRAMARARARTDALDAAQREQLARARAAAALGDQLAGSSARGGAGDDADDEPISPEGYGGALALALYREAAYWALRALAADARPAPTAAERAGADPTELAAPPRDLPAAYRAVPAERLASALDGAPQRDAFAAALVDAGPGDDAQLAPDALRARVAAASAMVRAVLAALTAREDPVRALWHERGRRLGALAVTLCALALLPSLVDRIVHPDIAPASRWRASSAYEGFPDTGVGFTRANGTAAFCHTQSEPSPWIEFDLGRRTGTTVGEVSVENRVDCCGERTVPLVIELADEMHQFTPVARRDEQFTTWTARFARRPARYVRLRVDRTSVLNLTSVAIR